MFPEYLLLSGFLQLCLFILNLISPARLYEFNTIIPILEMRKWKQDLVIYL